MKTTTQRMPVQDAPLLSEQDAPVAPLARIAPPTNATPLERVIAAIEQGVAVPIETLERMVALQERFDENRAKAMFMEAMVACQSEMPAVTRDRKNTQTNSMYATLEAVNTTIKPVYLKHGFKLSFGQDESTKPDHIRVKCVVGHSAGHTETYHLDGPLDATGLKGTVNKTPMHATASTASYLQRILITMIFNITIAGADRDGNSAPKDRPINGEEMAQLNTLIADTKTELTRFLAAFQVESMSELTIASYRTALAQLGNKKRKQEREAAAKGGDQ